MVGATTAVSFGSGGIRQTGIAWLASRAVAGLFALACLAPDCAAAQGSQAVTVLAYHRFNPNAAGPTTVTTATFRSQLVWLAQHHYRIVPLRSALAMLKGDSPREPVPAVAITADDGHKSIYTELFPLILKQRIPVTLFIYPSAISNAPYALTWEQLREMAASGLIDVESHTYWHPNFQTERRRLSPASYQAFVDLQLRKSKAVIEARLGKSVSMLAWPFGIVDDELEDAARRAGYVAAFAYQGGSARPGADLLRLPRIPVPDSARGDRFGSLVNPPQRQGAKP